MFIDYHARCAFQQDFLCWDDLTTFFRVDFQAVHEPKTLEQLKQTKIKK